jgi:hypothetical protein
MLHLRERIRILQSAGIDKIWMKVSGDGDFTMANVLVSGDGDFTMANVLGFFNADLILLLKTEPCWQCRRPFRAVVLASRNFLIRMIRCDGDCAVGKIAQELMLQGGLESDTTGPGQHAPTVERTI